MKFCPQCGTTFEPDARFCLECGFDRSSVGVTLPEPVSVPGTLVEETPATKPETNSEISSTSTEYKPACPQCSTVLIPGDRFCLECGFDTSAAVAEPIIVNSKAAEEIVPAVVIQPESSITAEIKQFCPQCGTVIAKDERFCPECGFDTSSEMPRDSKPVAIPEPPVFKPEPVFAAAKEEKASLNKTSYQQAQSTNPPVNTYNTGTREKAKKPWLTILLVVIGIGVLGAGGWFAYDRFFSASDEVTTDTTSIVTIPETNYTDTDIPETEITEVPAETAPEKPRTTAKPKSKIDQELEKYREKEKNKATQQTTQAPQAKQESGVKITPLAGGTEIKTEIIHEVGRKDEPKNKNPKNPVKLSIQKPTMIVRITTDHYNDGMGTTGGGTISIKDRDGNLLGTYKARGKTGTNGAPNAKWVAEPGIMLEKGTYYIWDSDFSTWSKTFVGSGFVIVEGYEVK
jgi:predicted amidophosphoribosyltransferase